MVVELATLSLNSESSIINSSASTYNAPACSGAELCVKFEPHIYDSNPFRYTAPECLIAVLSVKLDLIIDVLTIVYIAAPMYPVFFVKLHSYTVKNWPSKELFTTTTEPSTLSVTVALVAEPFKNNTGVFWHAASIWTILEAS